METSLDFLSTVLDEISLEGLDGITVATLWVRLENHPNFPISLDEDSKAFLWECIVVCKDIEAYELPNPRPVLQVYDRYDYVDPELGIPAEPPNMQEDLYPVKGIEESHVQGSCENYYTRIPVITQIRHGTVLLMSLTQAVEKWGDKLVLVASPKLRFLALLGTEVNPLIEITKDQYCLLERIGRSRFFGEVTVGEFGLGVVKGSFGDQIHYHIKKLLSKGLITKQRFYVRTRAGRMVSGSLLHLVRFYVRRQTKYEALMECLEKILKDCPDQRAPCEELRDKMGIKANLFKKLIQKHGNKCFKIYELPYREMYPDKEPKKHKNGTEVNIRVMELVQEYREEESSDEEKTSGLSIYTDFSRIAIKQPLMPQIYHIVKAAGPSGISLNGIQRTITLPRLDVRMLCRQLVRRQKIVSVLQDSGRQRVETFIAKEFIKDSEDYQAVYQQQQMAENSLNNDNNASKVSNSSSDSNAPPDSDSLFQQDVEAVDPSCQTNHKEEKASSPVASAILDDEDEAMEAKKFSYANKENTEYYRIKSQVIELEDHKTLSKPRKHVSSATSSPNTDGKAERAVVSQLSHRVLKRSNIITDYLKRAKIGTIFDLTKKIEEAEKKEGYNFRIDRRSVMRLVDRLNKEHKVKVLKSVLTSDELVKELIFVCDPSIDQNDEIVKSLLEKAKFKFMSVSSGADKSGAEKPKSTPRKLAHVKKSSNATKSQRGGKSKDASEKSKVKRDLLKACEPFFSKKLYGLQPKFVRIKTLHLYLFYLVHSYEGQEKPDGCDEPVVFNDTDCWKRYVPPLPEYKEKKGWCILSDVITCMPLSIFVKVVTLRYEIPQLSEMLQDPVKCNYLLRHLPSDLKNNILQKRRYAFVIFEVIIKLCHMGLICLGPKVQHDKEQVYIYVRKKATIKNTTISPPSYLHVDESLVYDIKEYDFNSMSDVENYWFDLQNICLSTNLNSYSAAAGRTIVVEESKEKPELKAAAENKEFNEVAETSVPPGDGLGAGGLDSSLYAHLRRNWMNLGFGPELLEAQSDSRDRKSNHNLLQLLLKDKKKDFHPESRERLQRLNKRRLMPPPLKRSRSSAADATTREAESPPAKRIKTEKEKKNKLRTIKALRNPRRRQPYLDQKDIEALKKLEKLRVDWTPEEDSFLLLCKVASEFLNPNSRTIVVSFSVIRDLLHEKFPQLALDKTSRACQRRLRHMLVKSEETQTNVSVFLGETLQDSNLVREFSGIKIPRTNEVEWRKIFTALLEKLLQKFGSSSSRLPEDIPLPTSMEMLQKHYRVSHPVGVLNTFHQHSEPSTIDQILSASVSLVVLSSVNSTCDGQNWAYTLYKIYDRYPGNMLKNVIQKLNKDRLITKVKITEKKALQNLTTIPYRLAVTYNNAFLTRYPSTLFSEAKELYCKLVSESGLQISSIEAIVTPGYISALLSLSVCQKLALTVSIPEQVLVFDCSLSEKQKSAILKTLTDSLTDQESQDLAKLLNPFISAVGSRTPAVDGRPKRKKQKTSNRQPDCVDSTDGDCLNASQFNVDLAGDSADDFGKTASRLALHVLRQQSSSTVASTKSDEALTSQEYIAVNPCKVFYELKDNGSRETIDFVDIPKAVFEGSQKTSEFECVHDNSSDIPNEVMDKKSKFNSKFNEIARCITLYIPGSYLVLDCETVESHLATAYARFSDKFREEGKMIFEAICSAKELGISHRDLWRKFGCPDVELHILEHLAIMRDTKLVVRVGVCTFHYVAVMHCRPWVIHCFPVPQKTVSKNGTGPNRSGCSSGSTPNANVAKTQDESSCKLEMDKKDSDMIDASNEKSQIQQGLVDSVPSGSSWFVPRTWRKPDGLLNCDVFIQFLSTVLCYIMANPGTSEERICERFALVFQPVQTLELLEVLENFSCIFRYHLKCSKKASLFSPLQKKVITGQPSPEDSVFYESSADAIFRFNDFRDLLRNTS